MNILHSTFLDAQLNHNGTKISSSVNTEPNNDFTTNESSTRNTAESSTTLDLTDIGKIVD